MAIGDFLGIFELLRGKDTPSPPQLAQKLLRTLPPILIKSFQIYVLGDTAFGTVDLLNQVRGDSFNQHAIVGIPKSRTLKDGRKVSEIKTRGQQVYLNDLDIPVYLSWVWLKRDGKRVQRFVISTKPMKGSTIARWGKRRWQIEAFFKTVKHRQASSSLWTKNPVGSLSLVDTFFYFLFISILDIFTQWK